MSRGPRGGQARPQDRAGLSVQRSQRKGERDSEGEREGRGENGKQKMRDGEAEMERRPAKGARRTGTRHLAEKQTDRMTGIWTLNETETENGERDTVTETRRDEQTDKETTQSKDTERR